MQSSDAELRESLRVINAHAQLAKHAETASHQEKRKFVCSPITTFSSLLIHYHLGPCTWIACTISSSAANS